MASSSVSIRHVCTGAPAALREFSLPSLARASMQTPRKLSSPAMRARTGGAFSPIPPVKTSASSPPRATVRPPRWRAALRQKDSTASAARASALARSSRMSELRCEIPSRPERLYSECSSSACPQPRVRIKYSKIPGSTEPGRVPMTSPFNVENPMVVATLTPSLIAHALAPLPRWATSRRDGRGPPVVRGQCRQIDS